MTTTAGAADPEAVALAAEALRRGSVVALPTDTVYGLAVDPVRSDAVERLFALKGRPPDIPLAVLIGSRAQVGWVAAPLEGAAASLAARFWPGPLTVVVPRAEEFTVDLGGPASAHRTVGVRWPDHPVVELLCGELGPLAVTSANLHGSPPATTSAQVAASFTGVGGPAVIVDGGVCNGAPSTVVECRGRSVRCLRDGAIRWTAITALLAEEG